MSQKKKSNSSSKKHSRPTPSKTRPKTLWIVGAVAVAIVITLAIAVSGASTSDQAAPPATAEEQYVGRFLPAGYESPTVADRTLYTDPVAMTVVTASFGEEGLSLPVGDVVDSAIVRFEYQRADGKVLPMIAYVKPSGALFTGVSYCPPCEGEGQRIEADGTLTCESCGTKRNLESNEGIGGACKLYPLDEVPATVSDGNILVETAVLDSWTAQPLDRPVG